MIILCVLGLVAGALLALALLAYRSTLRAAKRRYGWGMVAYWFFAGYHVAGPRACCERHCDRLVRLRRVRRRMLFPIMLTSFSLSLILLPLVPALLLGPAAGLALAYPRQAGRAIEQAARPVTSRLPESVNLRLRNLREDAIRKCPAFIMRWGLAWIHYREMIRPLAASLALTLEMPAGQVRKALVIPVSWQEPGTEVGMRVLPNWSATKLKLDFVQREIEQRLPGVEWNAVHHLSGTHRQLVFIPCPEPPEIVPFESVLSRIKRADRGMVLVGIEPRGRAEHINLNRATPHVATSVGTGGGKSELQKLIIIILLAQGVERITYIDPKGGSASWAEDDFGRCIVPGLEIHYDLPEQWQAIEDFGKRMNADYTRWRSDRRMQFQREILMLEEQNDFAEQSRVMWSEIKSRHEPQIPPPFRQIGQVLFKGRQAERNVISNYNRLSVRACGGVGDWRDQYGSKLLGRFSPAAWDSLVAERPRGRSSTIPGRMILVTGSDRTVIQVPRVTDEEALGFLAEQGIKPISYPEPPGTGGETTSPLHSVPWVADPRRSLRQHGDAKTTPLSYEGLKSAARRRAVNGFPELRGGLVSDSELRAWYDARGRESA